MKNTLLQRMRPADGFNLIEVSLALAICSIGLIALIGLIPTGIDASRRAADDTLAASLASDVLQYRHISPYTNSPAFPAGGTPLNGPRGTSVTVTLDAMGSPATNDDNSVNQFYTGPYFLVTSTVVNDPQFVGNPDIARVIVTVEWPKNASAANRTRRVFVSNFARMQ